MGALPKPESAVSTVRSHTAGCPHCGQAGVLAPVYESITRCFDCGYVFPSPRRIEPQAWLPELGRIADAAPDGRLRERYRLVALIGRGAHGLTYFAEHEFLNHPCVVKILPHRVEATDAAVLRLRSEARAGYRVNHPNVIRVLDCDAIRGVWYFVMEYVDGIDLAAIIEAGLRPNWQQAVSIALDAAAGLAAIHQAGLVHRDIKPANLVLGADGRLRVADLGVVGLSEEDSAGGGDASGEMVGTLGYAAPEMFAPEAEVGPQADLYSLGATLFHLLSGRLPHASGSVFRGLIDRQTRSSEWPADAPETPQWLRDTILRLLQPEPAERFESAAALVDALRQPVSAEPQVSGAAAGESLRPRGIAVLTFENRSGHEADNWLGYALADSLGRALSQYPGVYVAEQEKLTSILQQTEPLEAAPRGERLLEAGRLVGAGTIIEGHFTRHGDEIAIHAELHRAGDATPLAFAEIRGPLLHLAALQTSLQEQTARALALSPAAATPAASARSEEVVLAAREKFVLGKQAYLRGDYAGAIALAEQSSALAPDFIEPLQYIGACYARLGRYSEAAEHHQRAQLIAQQRSDTRLLIEAQANLGVMHYFQGDYQAALDVYSQAARTAEQSGLTAELAHVCNNLGFALYRLNRPAEAEQAFLKAVETHRAYGALVSLVGPYNGLGNVLLDQKRYAEAATYYRRALLLAEEVGDRANVGVAYMHLARCASLQGDYAEAKVEFARSLNALEETSFWNGLARAYEYMAEMNLKLGSYEEAARCADKRIELARLHANRAVEAAGWQQKAEALRRLGRNAEADACSANTAQAG